MTNRQEGLVAADPGKEALRVLAGLPIPDYPNNFQPDYHDPGILLNTIRELQTTDAVTVPRQIDAFSNKLADISEGRTAEPLLIIGGCSEDVRLETPISELVMHSEAQLRVIASSALAHSVVALRNRGQNSKPRSSATERGAGGARVPSYMGDAVNSKASHARQPDPTRMVAAAVQARDIEAGLTRRQGAHVPAAHEALLLAYEESFIRIDPLTGKQYLLSADLPWIGMRTNSPDGDHVEMLSKVENPVGVKIGPGSDEDHIKDLAARLNPEDHPGKLVLMLRVGSQHIEDRLPGVLAAIKKHAPESLLMYDLHGSTRSRADGAKVRVVNEIIKEIQVLAAVCQSEGMRLPGLHLETTPDNTRKECPDKFENEKIQPGNIDPHLNPSQTRRVLRAVGSYLSLQPAA